jgi:hypothetical protein
LAARHAKCALSCSDRVGSHLLRSQGAISNDDSALCAFYRIVRCGGRVFVAAELSRRGYVASLTLRNTRGIDILVANRNATKSVAIQVKATQGPHTSWIVGRFGDDEIASNLFFVFISMYGLGEPRYYIVPKREVVRYAESRHRQWLAGRKRGGGARKDSSMRKFADPDGKYLGRWDLLGLDAQRM